MSLLRSGLNQLSYTGVEALQPPNLTVHKRDPISGAVANRDIRTFNIGSLWLNDVNRSLWVLANKDGGVPTWVLLSGGGNGILSITGDTGGPVFGDGMQNVNVIGDGSTIAVAGSPGTNTLVISAIGGGGGAVITLTGNIGVATAATNNINVTTANASVQFVGSSDDLIQDFLDSIDGNLILGSDLNPGTRSQNTGLGAFTLNSLTNGDDNTAIGFSSLLNVVTGSENVGIGSNALSNLNSGDGNIAIGNGSGTNLTAGESNNIMIGNPGTMGISNRIQIGMLGTHTSAFMQGVAGVVVGSPNMVTINTATGQLGSQAIPGGGGLSSVSTTNATPQFITTLGNADIDFNLSNLVFGSSLPALTTGVANVGIGQNVLMSITTGERNIAIGFECLTSLTTGGANVAIGRRTLENATNSSSNFALGSSALQSATTSTNSNVAIGVQSMTLTTFNTQFNTSIGDRTNEGFTSGCTENVAIGHRAGFSAGGSAVTNVQGNTFIGAGAGNSGATGANFNLGIGYHSYWDNVVHTATGSYNTMIGYQAGLNYLLTESSNLILGHQGVVGDNNTIRIGTQGTGNAQQNRNFQAGIYNTAPAGNIKLTAIIDQNGQLGTGAAQAFFPYDAVNTTPFVVDVARNMYLGVDTSGSAITVQLPNSATVGQYFTVKDTNGNATTNVITVTTVGGSVLIDGATTNSLSTNYASASYVWNGTSYEVF